MKMSFELKKRFRTNNENNRNNRYSEKVIEKLRKGSKRLALNY